MTDFPGDARIRNYEIIQRLGSGAFASVWLARHVITHLEVAMKVIAKSSLDSTEARTRFAREVGFLKKMHHPFIAEFFEWIEDDRFHYLVMEYAANGSMSDFIAERSRLNELQARHYFSQLISVIDYLHNQRMVAHRDLKGDNILLDRHNNIRVIDFGLSNQFTRADPELKSHCGSPAFAAPEMIKGHPYTRQADIWSAGVVLYLMVCGNLPFEGDTMPTLLNKICYSELTFPTYLSTPTTDLLQKMLEKNPDERITLENIKEHHWFSKHQYYTLLDSYIDKSRMDGVIDQDIVRRLVDLGVDCRLLHTQLLVGEMSEIAAMYRQIFKAQVTERMKDAIDKMQSRSRESNPSAPVQFNWTFGTVSPVPTKPAHSRRHTLGKPGITPIPAQRPPEFRQRPSAPSAAPGVPAQRALQVPNPITTVPRRASKTLMMYPNPGGRGVNDL
jgi:serine/threonine protein kinase